MIRRVLVSIECECFPQSHRIFGECLVVVEMTFGWQLVREMEPSGTENGPTTTYNL